MFVSTPICIFVTPNRGSRYATRGCSTKSTAKLDKSKWRRLEYKNKDTKPTWRVPWSKGHSINNIQEVRFVSIEVRRYMYVILYIYMGITLASKIKHA